MATKKQTLLSYQPRFPAPGEKILCFDTETTSTDRSSGAIIEWSGILAEKQEDGTYKRLKEHSVYMNPFIPISADASAVNGITNEFIKTQPTEDEVWPEIKVMFDAADFVTGHNVPFDIGFTSDLAARCGYASCFYDLFTERSIDTLRLSRELTPLEHHKLGQLKDYFDIQEEGSLHDSLTDSRVTMKLYEILEKEFNEKMKEAEPKVKVRKTEKTEEKKDDKPAERPAAASRKAVKAYITDKNIRYFHYCDQTKTYGKAYYGTHVFVTCNVGKFDFNCDCDKLTWTCKEEWKPYDITEIAEKVFRITGTKDEESLAKYARAVKQKDLDTYEKKPSKSRSKKPA